MADEQGGGDRMALVGLLMQTTSVAEGQLNYAESLLRACAEGKPPDPRDAARMLSDSKHLRRALEIFKRQLAPLVPPDPWGRRWDGRHDER